MSTSQDGAADGAAARQDEQARLLIAEALDDTLIVEAAAGTGKTTALIHRIVAVLAAGKADVREIVAVTFTEKAAGELKLRLRERLEHARQVSDEAIVGRLDLAVRHLEEAHVSTIHGFCADLLRERPVEARVDPAFRVLTEGQAQRLFDAAFHSWFHEQLESPAEGLRRSLRRVSRGARMSDSDPDGPVERLRRAGFELTQWRDFRRPWTRDPFDRAGAVTRLVELVHACAEASASPSYAGDNLYVDTAPARRFSDDLRRAPHEAGDLDSLEGRLIELRRDRDFRRARKGSGPTYKKGTTRSQVLEARDALMLALADFQERADADLAALLQAELLTCVDAYERLKAREGALDFLDLLVRARDLVRDQPLVRRHFQRRFTRIFVDEFQDTDPLQAELLLLLAADDPAEARWEHVRPVPGKLFLVGDPKQSIYRFRRADVDVYRHVRERLHAQGGRAIELTASFRSVPAIQAFVNTAFAGVMDGDLRSQQASYVPLHPVRPAYPEQPSIVALPVPRPYGPRFVSARAIEESLPDAAGAYVHWLLDQSGWTVTERRHPARRVRIQPRHICLLFRRFVSFGEDVTRPYVEALEARGVPHLLVGGRAFHDREEIETLRAALTAIEWPDDQLSVFATLRGSFFAIGDEELLEYYHLGGRFNPFRIPTALPDRLAPVRDALNLLGTLHRHRNRRPVADTIWALLDGTRAHVGIVLRPAGEQALANVLHVAELGRQYEAEGGMSFRGFVESLRSDASGGAAAEAPILEEASDGVRLMTVHKAKGLEFPVVVLADMTARLTPFDASRHVDTARGLCALRLGGFSPKDLNDVRGLEIERETREGQRIAYVAATRARDLLVVPALGDGPHDEGWLAPLNAAIYPDESVRRQQTPAPGCPAFKSRDSVLERPDNDPARSYTVCPGVHEMGVPPAGYQAVWWSPEPDALALGAQPVLGLRRDDLIVRDVPPTVLRGYLDSYTAWRTTKLEALRSSLQPSIEVVTATEAALHDTIAVPLGQDVTIEELEPAPHRPAGPRFGSLVHALLSDAPLVEGGSGAPAVRAAAGGAAAHLLERLADAHGRMLGAPADEVAAAVPLVRAVLNHPRLRQAAAATARGRCHREAPVTYRTDSGAIVEGIVDLAFEHEGQFVVVDFKTDRPADDQRAQYVRQLGWYAAAVGRATGRPARGVLMIV